MSETCERCHGPLRAAPGVGCIAIVDPDGESGMVFVCNGCVTADEHAEAEMNGAITQALLAQGNLDFFLGRHVYRLA